MTRRDKLSKSDQDPHQTDRDAEALANMPKSQHFAKGTFIVYNNVRAEILAVESWTTWPRSETLLRVAWDDGTVSLIKPIALN